jgi:nitroimidazol reductase NimA-like FMN-containing flavoprotein (pyridoxamine 5'-phosphate oxidase superfamily)
MNFGEKSKMHSKEKITHFLNSEHIGHFTTIDSEGFPFTAPMNFVYYNDSIYIHGFPKGEKYDNIIHNEKCGFEVSNELAFLPSYFFEPKNDASKTDTLYVSVVIKGTASLVSNAELKCAILNAMMEKYQPEGGYEKLTADMATVRGVGMIKITANSITGRYKMGKYWNDSEKLQIAQRIMKRAVNEPKLTLQTLNVSGLGNLDDAETQKVAWKYSTEIVSLMGYSNELNYPEISLVVIHDVNW